MYTQEQKQMIRGLYAADAQTRLEAAERIAAASREGCFPLPLPQVTGDVNDHIHTTYSFSPYTPTAAVFKSREAGLATCGIMDHDSVSGAEEFAAAGRLFCIATTQGCEIRVRFPKDFADKRRINNPDQDGVAYVALHGIPSPELPALRDFLNPLRQARLRRNQEMAARLNELIAVPELALDFDRDVRARSLFDQGGEITERHILCALAEKLIAWLGRGPALRAYVADTLKLPFSAKAAAMLDDAENPYYVYDLLGLFKGYYVAEFYIPATDECPPIEELASFSREHGACLAYAYLGDVTASVTGDKKAQQFEDAYLDELFPLLKDLGFNAVTFMPSRNTREQLARVMALCERYNLFQISGEDINQPRQSFVCTALRDPAYTCLRDAAWALIGHERAAAGCLEAGMFSAKSERRYPKMAARTEAFRDMGLAAYERETRRS